jgi:ribonuclease VapC
LIVVDTSALVAIQQGEPEADQFLDILRGEQACVSSPSLFEYTLVMMRRQGGEAGRLAMELVHTLDIAVRDWTHEHAQLAAEAHIRFGRGRHPAQLNYGDCMAYALAKALDAPLLYKGDDFRNTDILSALPSA